MQVPVRLLQSIRPNEHPGVLLSTAFNTAALSVAPFLLPAIAAEYDVGLGAASLTTAGQLAGFVAGSWGAGRFLRPRGRVLGAALLIAVTVNAASALLPAFGLLVALRVVSGLGLGVIAWFAWALVFGDDRRMSEIAVVGPLVGVTTVPVAAELIERWGPEAVYLALAVTAVVPLAFSRRSGALEPNLLTERVTDTERHRATPEARAILVGLGLLTLGGSAVFTYGAAIALDRTTLDSRSIALAFSANALASIPAARWTGRRGNPGAWLAVCAACAVVIGTVADGRAFVVAIAAWGFAFWLGVPGAYSQLSNRSRHPQERAGDAQAIMAGGRVVGPLAGGVVLESLSAPTLGIVGGSVMGIGALVLGVVSRRPLPDPDGISHR